jgi:hypothetical protein
VSHRGAEYNVAWWPRKWSPKNEPSTVTPSGIETYLKPME